MPQTITIDVTTPIITRPEGFDYDAKLFHRIGLNETTRGLVISADIEVSLSLGEVFNYADFQVVNSGVDLNFTFTTPASPDIVLFAEITTSLAAELRFFENTTIGAGGTTRIPFDVNRRTQNTADIVIKENPVITADGTQLTAVSFGFTGQGNSSVGSTGGGGQILANSEDYLLRLTSLAAGNIVDVSLTLQERVNRIL